MYRQHYDIRKAINEELEKLETSYIIEEAEGPKVWVSNAVATLKSNGKVRLCLDARKINKAIKRKTFPIPTLDFRLNVRWHVRFKNLFEKRFQRGIAATITRRKLEKYN